MDSKNLIAIINLLNVPRVGQQKVRHLVSAFPNAADIFSLSPRQLCSVEGIDLKSAQAIRAYKDFEFGELELEKANELDIVILSFWDKDYPLLLRKIFDPPVVLYLKGKALQQKEDCVAIVGTRTVTQYGRGVTNKLAQELVSKGLVVVSGLARGIDTIAHRATLKAEGRTIAVLGNGIDVIYPAENRTITRQIQECGSIISEFPLGTQPEAGNFPQRNRIISGLSHGTVVIEAGNRSGAILTALNAVDQNREVFAVPGRIHDKQSLGCLRLIRNGAIPVENADRIMKHIESRLFQPVSPKQEILELDLTPRESQVIEHLSHEPVHIDDLATVSDIEMTQLLTILLELELKGSVHQLSGKYFVRSV